MAEYIEREYLLYKFIEIMPEMGVDELADEIYDIALNVEAKDVVPVVHGRWVYGEDVDIQCSVCGADALTEGDYMQIKSNYCPHCGARMDVKKEG